MLSAFLCWPHCLFDLSSLALLCDLPLAISLEYPFTLFRNIIFKKAGAESKNHHLFDVTGSPSFEILNLPSTIKLTCSLWINKSFWALLMLPEGGPHRLGGGDVVEWGLTVPSPPGRFTHNWRTRSQRIWCYVIEGEIAKGASWKWCLDCWGRPGEGWPWSGTESLALCGYMKGWQGIKHVSSSCILIQLWNYSWALLFQMRHSECVVCDVFNTF